MQRKNDPEARRDHGHSFPIALPNQHSRLADGTLARSANARTWTILQTPSWSALPHRVFELGLATERLADRPARAGSSRSNPQWGREFAATLPDLKDDDIAGSGFAIQGYTVHRDLGGDAALARLRRRLQQRGLKLMLDFVPNHMAPDHPWVDQHPEYFVRGSEEDLAHAPHNYCRVQTSNGPLVLAYGRDPRH